MQGRGSRTPCRSKTIAAVHDSDTKLIASGTYFDCTIAGGDLCTAVVLTDKSCADKAPLVIDGRDVPRRNLALTRVRVLDSNGNGIRAEGHHLTVDHVSVIMNQDCILAAPEPVSTTIVRDSTHDRNGACAHRIYVNSLKLLRAATPGYLHRQATSHSGAPVLVSA